MTDSVATLADPELTPHPDELESRQRIPKAEAAADAAALYRAERDAVLSTASARMDGWPFGSLAPYAADARGWPLIYVARIAEHGRNLARDPRCSLMLRAPAPDGVDAQTAARLTILGRAAEVPEAEREDAWARYVARLPDAAGYARTHDFRLLRLEPERLRYIGGFGRIFWLDRGAIEVDPAQDPLREAASGIVDHMNEDHRDALELLCAATYDVTPQGVRMVDVDQFGFAVETEGPTRRLRFDFARPASPDEVRREVVALVSRARRKLSGASS